MTTIAIRLFGAYPPDRTCWCGVTFTPQHPRQVNCTMLCGKRKTATLRRRAKYRQPRWLRCPRRGCGKRFKTIPYAGAPGKEREFCSPSCTNKVKLKARREIRKMRAKGVM